MGVAPTLGITQLTKRPEARLVAVPPVGALTRVDWLIAGWVPFVRATVHVDAPAMPAHPRIETTVISARWRHERRGVNIAFDFDERLGAPIARPCPELELSETVDEGARSRRGRTAVARSAAFSRVIDRSFQQDRSVAWPRESAVSIVAVAPSQWRERRPPSNDLSLTRGNETS